MGLHEDCPSGTGYRVVGHGLQCNTYDHTLVSLKRSIFSSIRPIDRCSSSKRCIRLRVYYSVNAIPPKCFRFCCQDYYVTRCQPDSFGLASRMLGAAGSRDVTHNCTRPTWGLFLRCRAREVQVPEWGRLGFVLELPCAREWADSVWTRPLDCGLCSPEMSCDIWQCSIRGQTQKHDAKQHRSSTAEIHEEIISSSNSGPAAGGS